MVLNIIKNSWHYEMEKLCMAFFPDQKIEVRKSGFDFSEDAITVSAGDCVTVSFRGKTLTSPKVSELSAAKLLYELLSDYTGIKPPWGVLTGVRPSKLMHALGCSKGVVTHFIDELLVSPERARLAYDVAKAEQEIISLATPRSFSLYISIPFCPTRCSYCSFVSSTMGTPSAKKLIPVYFSNLMLEIRRMGEVASKNGLRLLSAYVGGGTPGILDVAQTTELFSTVNSSFDMSFCREFTFEAGRPDTITPEKMEAAIAGGADRVSINPQTMDDAVLASVGRCHTSAEVISAYKIARTAGFSNINMDLIAGLPTDTVDGFKMSVDKLIDLDPEAITVHTLAYKRSADLDASSGLYARALDVDSMVSYANSTLSKSGYLPYYMYRQTKSVSNLENVGYCKPGFASAYNIFMMEECHSILACGAGAVSKIKNPHGREISRVFNFKYPYEYNSRFTEILSRKDEIDGRIQALY